MKTKMTRTLFVLLGVMVLVIGGCKKEPQPQPVSAPEAPAAQAPEAKPAPAPETGPIKVGAVFAITGGASYLGAPEAKTVEMLAAKINQAGGINGRKIEMIIKDTGGKPENAISMTKQLIEENKVLAILGPSTSGETMAIKNICQEGKTILLSCAAAEDIVNPIASYVFKTPQKDSDAARRIFQLMKEMGISKIGVITSNDGFGMAGKAQIEKLAPDYGITVVISEVYDKQETDLTGILTKIKGQDIGGLINWSIVPAQSLVAKNMKQIGLNVPLFQSHGFGNIKYVQAGGEAANGTIFPCGRLLVADLLPDSHPQKKLLVEYKKDYETLYKEDVSTFGGHAYDAFVILMEAIRKAGSCESEKVRNAIESLTGFVGTAGIFNFSAADHNGLGLDAFEMLTVKDEKFAIYTQ
jgi:branched-chain amino acid transport system substrate-binding protein